MFCFLLTILWISMISMCPCVFFLGGEVSIYLQIHVCPKIIIQVVVSSQRILDPWNSWSKKITRSQPDRRGSAIGQTCCCWCPEANQEILSNILPKSTESVVPPQKMPPIFGGIRQLQKVWWFYVILTYFPSNSTGFLYIQRGWVILVTLGFSITWYRSATVHII